MKEKIITKKILKWYDLNKRSLPWRKNVTFQKRQYYTLVSEFMLQQTQVATVIPYFNRFIKDVSNLKALSKVQNKKLIKLWEGLGYYSRVRNLKKTAQKIIKNFNGKLPDNFEDLVSLPGIGNYTASAILSIAFDKPYIPLDGNIERVLKRYLYLKKDKITNEALASNSDTEKVDPADDAIKNGVQYIYSILDEVIKGNIDINLKTHIKSDTGLRHLHIVQE